MQLDNDKLTEKPAYFAIVPAFIRYDKDLSPNAKLLYGEITALLNFRNKCFASNKYFSRLYDITEIQVSRLLKQLIDKNYIVSDTEITAKGSQRLIRLPDNINVNPPLNKNVKEGINKNVKHNNHSINNPSLFNNKEDASCLDSFIIDFNRIRKSKFTLTKKVKGQLVERLKKYSCKDLITALENAMKNDLHVKNNFNSITPAFITREDVIEMYLNFTPLTVGNSDGKYPNVFSKKFHDTLQGSALTDYWKHLRGQGYRPIKNARNEVIEWAK